MERPRAWQAVSAAEALAALGSDVNGLSDMEARQRLDAHGVNRLPEQRSEGPLQRLVAQFRNPLIYTLLAAAAISVGIGHGTDAMVIAAVVLVNALIGFVQEGRAERALAAIRDLVQPQASVRRDGRRQTIPAEAVVPGDVVLLEAGDRVPADLRLVEARGLRIDQAVLTGESVPVDKVPEAVSADATLADRQSMAFSGTLVTAGMGLGVAVATGAASELGRIGVLIGAVEPGATPLMRQMQGFARQLTVATLAVAVVTFGVATLVRDYPVDVAFMAVVGLAVAAIPEGLPTVMTIALAIGVQRMAARNAIVRHLPAVETLGSVSVICTDKTGTLTRNEMLAASVVTAGGTITVEGESYRPAGAFTAGGAALDPASDPVLEELALAAALCNDAQLRQQGDSWRVEGDPMEGALLALSAKAGHDVPAARAEFPRRDAIPFDARHRYMASLHARPGRSPVIFVKGAPERLLAMCTAIATPEGTGPLDRDAWARQVDTLAGQGQRVLALARRGLPAGTRSLDPKEVEHDLVLLGLVGLIDPPRPEARAAIAECRKAGIAVKMVTGDHAATARAIATQLGLESALRTLTGADLDRLDGAEFAAACREATVFARTSAEDKLRLVDALQAGGLVVAMTGDGVNDAPALKRADIGVAMGNRGTEAAKEASAIVLADDNFASIVAAVREGRTVHDNIRKLIGWTLPTDIGEGMTIVLAIAFGLTLPISAVQILWVNMVTTVALGLTLAFEPTEPGTMRRAPRPAGEPLLTPGLVSRIFFVSAVVVAGAFGSYAWATARGLSLEAARTMVVNALVVMEIFYLFSVRYVHGPSLTWQGVLGTPAVWIGIAISVVAQIAFTYAPPLQGVFGSAALAPAEVVVALALGPLLLVAVEIGKWAANGDGGART
jgi:magnesium-transporting ATPase (P-type)